MPPRLALQCYQLVLMLTVVGILTFSNFGSRFPTLASVSSRALVVSLQLRPHVVLSAACSARFLKRTRPSSVWGAHCAHAAARMYPTRRPLPAEMQVASWESPAGASFPRPILSVPGWLATFIPADESWDWIPAEEGAGRSRLVTVHQRRGQWQNEMAPSTTGRIQRITKEDHYRCWHCVPPGAGRHGWPRQDNGCHRSQGRAAGAAGRICKTDTYDEPRRGGGLPEGLRPAWPQSLSWNRLSPRTSRDFWVRVRSWLTTWTERTAVN